MARVIVTVVLRACPAAVVVFVLGGGDRWTPGRWRPRVHGQRLRRAAGRRLLFFAFAGYARIATLGEEVRDPARTIPRAIPLALGITLGCTPSSRWCCSRARAAAAWPRARRSAGRGRSGRGLGLAGPASVRARWRTRVAAGTVAGRRADDAGDGP